MQDFHHLIDGHAVRGRRFFDVVDPATGEPFERGPDATPEDVDAATEAAARAFGTGGWAVDEDGRRALLVRVAETLASHAEPLARLLAQEQGKPLARAL